MREKKKTMTNKRKLNEKEYTEKKKIKEEREKLTRTRKW